MQHGLLIYGSVISNETKPTLLIQKRVIRLIFPKTDFHFFEVFEVFKCFEVFKLYRLELIKFALKSLSKSNCSEHFKDLFLSWESSSLQAWIVGFEGFVLSKKCTLMPNTSLSKSGVQLLEILVCIGFSQKICPDVVIESTKLFLVKLDLMLYLGKIFPLAVSKLG